MILFYASWMFLYFYVFSIRNQQIYCLSHKNSVWFGQQQKFWPHFQNERLAVMWLPLSLPFLFNFFNFSLHKLCSLSSFCCFHPRLYIKLVDCSYLFLYQYCCLLSSSTSSIMLYHPYGSHPAAPAPSRYQITNGPPDPYPPPPLPPPRYVPEQVSHGTTQPERAVQHLMANERSENTKKAIDSKIKEFFCYCKEIYTYDPHRYYLKPVKVY